MTRHLLLGMLLGALLLHYSILYRENVRLGQDLVRATAIAEKQHEVLGSFESSLNSCRDTVAHYVGTNPTELVMQARRAQGERRHPPKPPKRVARETASTEPVEG